MTREVWTDERWQEMWQERDRLAAIAEKFHHDKKLSRKHLATVFRCEKRKCPLLYVYDTVQGLILHQPRYKNSEIVNAESSSESGRRANTIDGDRRWKSQSYFFSQVSNPVLNCDHIDRTVVTDEEIEAAVKKKRRTVVVS